VPEPVGAGVIGKRLDALTVAEERGLPDGTRAEHIEGVYHNDYVKQRGRWVQSMNRGLVRCDFPWAARLTYIPST